MHAAARGWICCQLGAREHFALPRALHSRGRLVALVTDAWARSGAGPFVPRRLRERFHAELADARVAAATLGLVRFELAAALAGAHGWERMTRRNAWFQRHARREIERIAAGSAEVEGVFSFSYAAGAPFELARAHGWRTALGQIDPGPAEERIVSALHARHPELAGPWAPAPPGYWDAWRRECDLADVIVVNSAWSRDALVAEGVSAGRVRVVPLAYDPPPEAAANRREYPARFSTSRPLRLLFLGQLTLRKGMAEILEVMERFDREPVEFRFVGAEQMSIPARARARANARWIGAVPRGEVARHYRECDAFLFPTHSDGFGLTQLEARAWGLPIVASRRCGDVVRDGVDGAVLEEVSAAAIERVVRAWLEAPGRLAALGHEAARAPRIQVADLGAMLLEAIGR